MHPNILKCDNRRCGRMVSCLYRTWWLIRNKDICEVCMAREKIKHIKPTSGGLTMYHYCQIAGIMPQW